MVKKIIIEGNIGSGKSTLMEYLQTLDSYKFNKIKTLKEPVDEWKKLIGIITKGDIIKAYNRQRLTRKKMSLDEKQIRNKLLIEKYRYNKMSPNKDDDEIRLGDADSGVKAKSSPSLTSLFERLVEVVKKYW